MEMTFTQRADALRDAVYRMQKAFNRNTRDHSYDPRDPEQVVENNEAQTIFRDTLKAVSELRENAPTASADGAADRFLRQLSAAKSIQTEQEQVTSRVYTTRQKLIEEYAIRLEQHSIPQLRASASMSAVLKQFSALFDMDARALQEHAFTTLMPETCEFLFAHKSDNAPINLQAFFERFRTEYAYLDAREQREVKDSIPEIYEQFSYLQAAESLNDLAGILHAKWRDIESLYPNEKEAARGR